MGPYAPLLAHAAKPYGGASAADWLAVLGSNVDPLQRTALRPLAQSLADLSGHGVGSLFSGTPACASGLDALERAHAAAFGPAVPLAAMLAATGTDAVADSDARRVPLPRRLADDLLQQNEDIWRSTLRAWLDTVPQVVRAAWDGSAWLDAQQPHTLMLPVALRHRALAVGLDWRALRDNLDAAADAAAAAMVERTGAALRRESLPGQDLRSQAARCLDLKFLHRHFRSAVWQGLECMHLHGKRVGHRAGVDYVSDAGYRAWADSKAAQQAWLKQTVVKDTTGQCGPRLLAEVVRTPAAERAELLTFMVGINTLASEEGLVPAMLTLTLPPIWHSNPKNGHCSWGGAAFTPDAGLRWLNDQWAKCLRDLDNQDIRLIGLRVVEPQNDSCPHQHVLAYLPPEREAEVLATLCARFGVPVVKLRTTELSASGSKKTHTGRRYHTVVSHFVAASGAECAGDGDAHQIEWSRINPAVATATSYVCKYLMKALDADELVRDAATAAAAHAAGWRYRRFALFGIRKSKTLWRELRRADKPLAMNATGEALWGFARSGDAAAFLRLLGGLRPGGGLRVQTLVQPYVTIYGDDAGFVVGAKVLDADGGVVVCVITHEYGRYQLVPLDEELLALCEPPGD